MFKPHCNISLNCLSLMFFLFQVVVVDPIHSFTPSLLHSITPSLHHFPLDIWKPGGSSQMKLEGNECLSENLNLTPTGDLCGRCLSFIIPLKDTTENGIGSITSCCSREDPTGTCRPDLRKREISRNQA